jgi:hypothetical protein
MLATLLSQTRQCSYWHPSSLLPGWSRQGVPPASYPHHGHKRVNHLAGPVGDAPLLLLGWLGRPSASSWLPRLLVLAFVATLVRPLLLADLVGRCAAVVLDTPAALPLPSSCWLLLALLLR